MRWTRVDEREKAQVRQNKAIRGYIIRCLVKGYNNSALTRQVSNAMIAAGLVISPDISKYLDYLLDAGYIEFTDGKVTAYNAYANDPEESICVRCTGSYDHRHRLQYGRNNPGSG